MAFAFHGYSERRAFGSLFLLVLLLGLVLAFFPMVGFSTLILAVFAFMLVESVLSVMLGFELRERQRN
jgi:uncharacterized membrane protein HdeD (DUF308 family)